MTAPSRRGAVVLAETRRPPARAATRDAFVWIIDLPPRTGAGQARVPDEQLAPVSPDGGTLQACLEALLVLRERHGEPAAWPSWVALDVRGVRLSDRLRALCENHGLTSITRRRDGFRAGRPTSA